MNLLLSNASIYEQIKSAGKGGYGERVMKSWKTLLIKQES